MWVIFLLLAASHVPVSIAEAFKLGRQQAHEGGAQSAARDQVLGHEGGEEVHVQRGTVQPGRAERKNWSKNRQATRLWLSNQLH